jgi:hypothetical protein
VEGQPEYAHKEVDGGVAVTAYFSDISTAVFENAGCRAVLFPSQSNL